MGRRIRGCCGGCRIGGGEFVFPFVLFGPFCLLGDGGGLWGWCGRLCAECWLVWGVMGRVVSPEDRLGRESKLSSYVGVHIWVSRYERTHSRRLEV